VSCTPNKMSAHSNKNESPNPISSKKEGLKIIANVLCALETAGNQTAPICGMLYLKFKTGQEMDEWCATFRYIINDYWTEKMKKPGNIHSLFVIREGECACAVLFAESKEILEEISRMQFPDIGV